MRRGDDIAQSLKWRFAVKFQVDIGRETSEGSMDESLYYRRDMPMSAGQCGLVRQAGR